MGERVGEAVGARACVRREERRQHRHKGRRAAGCAQGEGAVRHWGGEGGGSEKRPLRAAVLWRSGRPAEDTAQTKVGSGHGSAHREAGPRAAGTKHCEFRRPASLVAAEQAVSKKIPIIVTGGITDTGILTDYIIVTGILADYIIVTGGSPFLCRCA